MRALFPAVALVLCLRTALSAAAPLPASLDRKADTDLAATETMSAPPPRVPATRRVLPAAAAVVPGLVVRGAGHFALGQPRTARNLLALEGIGLGLFLSGGLTIVFTGASRYFVAPAASATMLGFGLFSTSYLADIYGTVSNDGGAALTRLRPPARWETELGYRHIEDPEFAYRDFMVERVSRQIGAFRLSPSGMFSLAGDTARYRLEGQYRLAGNVFEPRPRDVSFVDVTLAFVHQRHPPEHFSRSHAELSFDARYDFGRLGPTLRGSFMELGAGYALARTDYDLSGLTVPHDLEHVLLGRIGFGVTLRGQSAPGSEALVYYDHRHDDYVAGLRVKGIGSGVLGHFGLATRWFVTESVGFLLDAQVGSAYWGGVSLLFRSGAAAGPESETKP